MEKLKASDIFRNFTNFTSKVFVLYVVVICAEVSLSLAVNKTSCNVAKSCYSEPADCSSSVDCNYLVTFRPDGAEHVTFELSAREQWAAVGFSENTKMPNTDVLLCLRKSDGSVEAAHYWAESYGRPTKTVQGSRALTVLMTEYKSGVLSCRVSRPKRPGIKNMRDLSNKLFLLYARGRVVNDVIQQHSARSSSPNRVDLTTISVLKSAPSRKSYLIAHGALMIIAWLGFASVGMFLARYMRRVWSMKLYGKDIWFQAHRTLMITTVIATIAGIILVFYFKDWQWSANAGVHPILGIVVLVLAVLQPIIATLRPHPDEARRWLFNWVHRSIGFSAFILAVATVFLGLLLPTLNTKMVGVYLMIAFCVYVSVIVAILELHSFTMNNEMKSQSFAMTNMKTYSGSEAKGHTNDKPSSSMSNKDKLCRRFALAFTIFVVSAISFTLIILIGIKGQS